MKQIIIIPKNKAVFLLKKENSRDSVCYYLNSDYNCFVDLQNRFADRIKIKNLSGLFEMTFQEIKDSYLELTAGLNKNYNSREWWSTQIASRNNASTPVLLNITFLFCAKKILEGAETKIVFIVDSQALSDCISRLAKESGYQVISYRNRIFDFLCVIKRWSCYIAKGGMYFWQSWQNRKAALKYLKPLPAKKPQGKKRVIFRSWVTQTTFSQSGNFRDRNFGDLSAWLHSQDYEVWALPMFANVFMKTNQIYSFLSKQRQLFLIPYHYLKLSDYVWIYYEGCKMLARRIKNATIKGIDVAALFNEVIKQGLEMPDLCYPLLERLKKARFEIDAFYYAFENNPPEKQFVLAIRKHYPDCHVVGFQHTAFYPNQMAHHLVSGEEKYHPLPDKIVCSGSIHNELLEKAGFPRGLLLSGPNLRYETVHRDDGEVGDNFSGKCKKVFLPLTVSYDLAFDLFLKVNDALKGLINYKVYIRNHPSQSKKKIERFLNNMNINDYVFANEGIIQDWLPQMSVVISTGGSITIIEAAAMGIPIVRVIPDNTFFYDPFVWPDYPLAPINTAEEIRAQLYSIDEILYNDREIFNRIGRQVLKAYFTKPNEKNMRVFL